MNVDGQEHEHVKKNLKIWKILKHLKARWNNLWRKNIKKDGHYNIGKIIYIYTSYKYVYILMSWNAVNTPNKYMQAFVTAAVCIFACVIHHHCVKLQSQHIWCEYTPSFILQTYKQNYN